MKHKITRAFIHAVCWLSEITGKTSMYLDRVAIGRKIKEAEKIALGSTNPEDAEKFRRAIFERADLMPDVCTAKMILGMMWNQVMRRHGL